MTELQLRTAEEAAGILRVSRDWLMRQAAAGQIPHHKAGRQTLFGDEDIAEIRKSMHVEPVRSSHRSRQLRSA